VAEVQRAVPRNVRLEMSAWLDERGVPVVGLALFLGQIAEVESPAFRNLAEIDKDSFVVFLRVGFLVLGFLLIVRGLALSRRRGFLFFLGVFLFLAAVFRFRLFLLLSAGRILGHPFLDRVGRTIDRKKREHRARAIHDERVESGQFLVCPNG